MKKQSICRELHELQADLERMIQDKQGYGVVVSRHLTEVRAVERLSALGQRIDRELVDAQGETVTVPNDAPDVTPEAEDGTYEEEEDEDFWSKKEWTAVTPSAEEEEEDDPAKFVPVGYVPRRSVIITEPEEMGTLPREEEPDALMSILRHEPYCNEQHEDEEECNSKRRTRKKGKTDVQA